MMELLGIQYYLIQKYLMVGIIWWVLLMKVRSRFIWTVF